MTAAAGADEDNESYGDDVDEHAPMIMVAMANKK